MDMPQLCISSLDGPPSSGPPHITPITPIPRIAKWKLPLPQIVSLVTLSPSQAVTGDMPHPSSLVFLATPHLTLFLALRLVSSLDSHSSLKIQLTRRLLQDDFPKPPD